MGFYETPQLYPAIKGLMSEAHPASGLLWGSSSQPRFVPTLDLKEGGEEDRALWLLHRRSWRFKDHTARVKRDSYFFMYEQTWDSSMHTQ